MATRNQLDRPFELKSLESNGTFTGIASPFGEEDNGHDIVVKGAFKKTIADFQSKGRKVPMLWQHDNRAPIGVYTDLKETDTALEVAGEINMDVQKGREAHALMKQGALSGLSIGYSAITEKYDDAGVTRQLLEVKLWEISPVTFPMADSARISTVKSLTEAATLSDCEQILRDAGFSKSEATAFTAQIKAIVTRSDSADGQAKSISRALAILKSV